MKRILSRLRFESRLCRCTVLLGLGVFLFSLTSFEPGVAQNSSKVSNEDIDSWESFTVKDRDFSVSLPAVPAMSAYDRDEDTTYSKINLRNLIAVYSEGTVYAIYIYDRHLSLDDVPKHFSIPEGALKRDIKVAGIRGKEYGRVDGNNRNQFFVAGSYIYQFATQSARREGPDANVARFFGSIKFEKARTGREILEGPGEVPPTYSLGAETTSAERVFSGRQVTTKVVVVTKPVPSYTELARKNAVTGTVVLRAVFTSAGAVNNVHAVVGLPNGLTEKAMKAARQIKFIPAIKDGKFVSQHIQLEYNFNLY